MRKFLQSWPGRLVLVCTLVPMAFLGVQGTFGTSISPNELIKVGDQSVTVSAYQAELNTARSNLLQTVDASLIDERTLGDEVLQSMISRALLQNQTQFLGMTVSDEAITRLLQQEPAFQSNGQFSNDLFAQYLQHNGLTKDMLFQDFRTQLSLRQLTAGVLGTVIYPENQVKRLLDLQLEAREVWVHRYAWQDFADQVSVSDAEIDSYYQKNQDTLVRPDTVDLAYIELNPQTLKVEAPSAEEIQAQYQSYLSERGISDGRELAQILLSGDDAKARADAIKAKLDAGESFEVLAKQSDDPSGEQGGFIGAFNPAVFGDDAGKVTQALASLGVGDVSAPVQTSFGYQIFKVVKQGDAPSAASLNDELTQRAIEHKRQVAFNDVIVKINDLAANGMGITDIAQQVQLEPKSIKAYPKTNNSTALPQPAVIAAAFDEFAVEDQSVSANITLNDKTVWVQPSNYQAAKPLSLQEASAQIKALLTKQKASELALSAAKSAATEVAAKQGAGLMTPKANFGIVTRHSTSLSPKERASLFLHKSEGNDVWAVATDDGASVIVGAPVASQSSSQLNPAERLSAARMIRDNVGQDQLMDYVQYLRDTNEVIINESALNAQPH